MTDNEWVTVKEAAEMLGISPQAIKKNCKTGRYVTRMVDGNGGTQYRILRQSLSERVQGSKDSRVQVVTPSIYYNAESVPSSYTKATEDRQATEKISGDDGGALHPSEPTLEACLEPHPPSTTSFVSISSGTQELMRREDPPVSPLVKVGAPRAGLATWQAEIARVRFDLVMKYMQAKQPSTNSRPEGGKGKTARAEEFSKFYNTGIPYPELFKKIGPVAKSTLDTWESALKDNKFNCDVLAVRYGEHRKGLRRVSETEMTAMKCFALRNNQLHIEEVLRHARKMLNKDFPGLQIASNSTLRRALYDWRDENYDRWVFMREGRKNWKDKVAPYLIRAWEKLEVGDVLVADGHTLNFKVKNPQTGSPCRPTLLMFYDWRSRFPAGWYLMMTENTQCIHAALRHAIISLGKIPNYIYLDNGKAFRSRFFTETPDFEQAGIHGLYARLGIHTSFALPYNAQSKPVERFFGTFSELERLMPTYSGTSIETKPAHLKQNEKLHKRMHERMYRGFMPTIEQADLIISEWIYNEYGMRPHSGINGKLPREVYEAGRGPGIDVRVLIGLMMSAEIKTLYRNGVLFRGKYYFADELYGRKGRVLIRYDDLDIARVYVFEDDGSRFICEARKVDEVHPMVALSDDPMDRKALEDGMRIKNHYSRITEAKVREITGEIKPVFTPSQEVLDAGNVIELHAGQSEEMRIPEDCVTSDPSLVTSDPEKENETRDTRHESRPFFNSLYERYEWHLEQGCQGADDEEFIEYFKSTAEYKNLYEQGEKQGLGFGE